MTAKDETRTFQSTELGKDHDGYFVNECPACGQDWARVFLGSLCVDCGATIYLEEATVSWDE